LTVEAPGVSVPGVLRNGRLVVLTGAGLSTDSGIPDYRGPGSRARQPMTYQEFLSGPEARQRYWARSHLGWSRMRTASPNAGHRALAALHPELLITQNVDGLHSRAGSRNVIDLHGRLDAVRCMACGHLLARAGLQRQLLASNPAWAGIEGRVAPDGDVDLDGRDYGGFLVPDCPQCGGVLKPDVVFFGENVPRHRVEQAFAGIAAADALLVVGSSLMVSSGYRFAEAAAAAGKPVAAVNLGKTRADHLLALKINAPCEEALSY
jgi:NAD-dependent SIR2 family protein deacetylase